MRSHKDVREAADAAYARYCAARADLLSAISELDETSAWGGDGASDLASWLAARWQIAKRNAIGFVKEAESMSCRPGLHEALSRGEVSIDQAKAVATLTVGEPADVGEWLRTLPFWSITELEREARRQAARRLEKFDGGVYFRMRPTRSERFMRGTFQVPFDDGAVVLAAVESGVPNDTSLRDWDRACAISLVELARGAGVRTTVMLSVSDEAISKKAGDDEVASVTVNGTSGFVSKETARRLSCDASVQVIAKDAGGRIVAMTDASPSISAATRRAVYERDGGMCAFEGCERTAYLDCHHIVHRADGGPGVASNLLLLCHYHHTLLHEGGWSVEGEAGRHMTWIRPDGSRLDGHGSRAAEP